MDTDRRRRAARRPLAGLDRLRSSPWRRGTVLPSPAVLLPARGVTARVALADTPGAAHAAARFGTLDIAVVSGGEGIDALQRDPARLVDVVAGRIGARSVFRIAHVPSRVPERAVTQADPVDAPGRDHYRVEDGEGGRWWVFRRGDGFEAGTGDLSWWMHGMFA